MNKPHIAITTREREVLLLLAKGITYSEIALHLGVTSETVKKHLKNIYRKLQVSNKIAALTMLKFI